MWLITNSGLANCNMVGALGSIFTRDRSKENFIGFVVYLCGGVMFSVIYDLILAELFTIVPSAGFMISAGMFIGFAHGLVVSYAIIAIFSERHVDKRFQQVSIGIGIAHLIAHVLFGFTIGALFSYNYGLVDSVAIENVNPMVVYASLVLLAVCFLMVMFSIERRIQKALRRQKVRKRMKHFAR
jgi:hypothetical protein